MLENIILILLIISVFALSLILVLLKKQKKDNQIKKIFKIIIGLAIWWVLLELLQLILHNNFNASTKYDIYFETFASIGKCFMPVFIFLLGLVFARTKIQFNKKYYLLFIIPTLTIILMLTNEWHHLVYAHYSVYTYQAVLGPYAIIHQLYSYGILALGMIFLLFYSIKNSGFFSKQSILFILGTLMPVIVNVLETYKIVELPVYSTPISFAVAVVFYALAIFKFDFIRVTPIALQRIVDRMSDSYIVLGDDLEIIDFNKTFLTTFKVKNETSLRGKNFEEVLHGSNFYNDFKKAEKRLIEVKTTNKTFYFELYINEVHKYFNVEINSILSKGQSLGTLILFKDITQHKRDIQTIKDTQDSLMESERLSSLGQLIGGIAHNLKTPIMSIAGAAEGLTDLVKEYDESIDDPTVNSKDHHEIAQDMSKWIVKIKEYSEYMSDVITAVKGQAVVMANEDDITFTVSELVKRINILMKHELKNAIINLDIDCKIDDNIQIHGDVNNLVQVINNMISNAIQAYNGKTNETIKFVIDKEENNVVFSIEDRAGGLPEKVKTKLFKEMITTKGKNGTGLGLYMSYSTIKAHFNGNITFETEAGVGTKFNILIPVE
ncbi:MAG: hypothetical protein IJH76_02600 [Clostridia bacterium]|nr:hypothetical protein [Clostridia bacterium]